MSQAGRRRPTLGDLPAPPPGRTGWPWAEETPPASEEQALPRVSIVTPSFNQSAFIEETIRSVLLQNYGPMEYIVVDGGSNDGTVDILRRYEPWLTWLSEPDGGQAEAINKGLRLAKGEVLAYLNSDDIYCPGCIQAVASFIHARPRVGLAYGDCHVIDEGGHVIGYLPRREFSRTRMIERGEFLPQQAVFWRREAMERVGLFDERLHYAMDLDFFIRVGGAFPVEHLPVPLASFRMHASSKTASQSEKHWREALAVCQRHGLAPWNPWYWLRRLRHWGLRALPLPLQAWVRKRLERAQDPFLFSDVRGR